MGYYAIYTSESIQHHGIKGQKHGIRNADWYPISAWKAHLSGKRKTSDGSHSTDKVRKKHNQNKINKQRAATLKKAREAKVKNAALKKEREEIIKSGDVDAALKRIDEFSNEELRQIRERYKAKNDTAQAKTDKMLKDLGNITDVSNKIMNLANNSINTYNAIAKIANTFGDKNMKIISNNDKKKDKKKDKKNEDD